MVRIRGGQNKLLNRKITVGTLKNVSLSDFMGSLRMRAKAPHLIERLQLVSAGKVVTHKDGLDILNMFQSKIEAEKLCDHTNQDAGLAASDALNFLKNEIETLEFPSGTPALPDEEYEVVDKDELSRLQRENTALHAEVARLQPPPSQTAQEPISAKTTEVDLSAAIMHEKAQAGRALPSPADISERIAAETQQELERSKQRLMDIFESVADKKSTLKGNKAEIEMLTEDHKIAAQLIRDRAQEIEKEVTSLAEEREKAAQEARNKFIAGLAQKISDPAQREEKKQEILSGKTPLASVKQINHQYEARMRAILNAAAEEFETDISSVETWKKSLTLIKNAAEERARSKEAEATQAFPEKRQAIAELLDQIATLSVQAEDILQNTIKSISSQRIDFVLGNISENLAGLQNWVSGLAKFIEDVRQAVAEKPVVPAPVIPPVKKAARPVKKAAEPVAPPPAAAAIPKDASPEVQQILSSQKSDTKKEEELAILSMRDPSAAAALQALLPDDIGDLDD